MLRRKWNLSSKQSRTGRQWVKLPVRSHNIGVGDVMNYSFNHVNETFLCISGSSEDLLDQTRGSAELECETANYYPPELII